MERYQKAVVVTNGNIEDFNMIKKHIARYGFSQNNLIVSADGGAGNALKLELVPDLVVGDMDSISQNIQKKIKSLNKDAVFISESPQKDETDTQLALQAALKYQVKEILIIGAIGNRVDHSLANIVLLSSPFLSGIDVRILTETNEIFAIREPAEINGDIGKLISLFSLTPHTHFKKVEGLKYNLEDEKLYFSPVRGISNIFTQNKVLIDITSGQLLIIKEI